MQTIAGAAILTGGVLLRGRVTRLVVDGPSMEPALLAGDRVVAIAQRVYGVGEMVALRDPRDTRQIIVKRIHEVGPEGISVRGDNPGSSTDSREFGPVSFGDIVGSLRYRYNPPSRAGSLRPGDWPPVTTMLAMSRNDLERLLNPMLVDNLPSLALEEVRRRRSACQHAEAGLSYLRRIAQGRLDIVLSELERRRGGGEDSNVSQLVDHLPEILSEHDRPGGWARPDALVDPEPDEQGAIADLSTELDRIASVDQLTNLPQLSDEQITGLTDGLGDFERRLSEQRRALHDHIDLLQEDIVRRYKTGEASVDGLLS